LNGSEGFEVEQHLNETLSQLSLKWMWKASIQTGVGFSDKAVWSRAFRRQSAKGNEEMEENDGDMAFGFKIHLEQVVDLGGTRVTIRWLKGHNCVIFESFCGMVKRKLEEQIK
jgi:23S rRNA (adenine1618-N6)-methyltransferase